MNETDEVKMPQETAELTEGTLQETAEQRGGAPEEKPGKQKRSRKHEVYVVLPLALLLMFAGTFAGELACILLQLILRVTSDAGQFLFMYLSFIGIDVLVLLYAGTKDKEIFATMRYRGKGGENNTWGYFLLGILAGFVMNAACALVALLHGDISLYAGEFHGLYLLAAFFCVLIQSGAEELLCRGYVYGALSERYNKWFAAVVNAAFFAALHLGNPGITAMAILNIFLVGFALSIAMMYLHSLWFCIAVHTAWNFTQNFLLGLPNSGIVSQGSFLHLSAAKDSLFYDVQFGVESTIQAGVVMILLAAAVIVIGRRMHFEADA